MSQNAVNALVGQAGGPTVVINQSLVGVVEACVQASGVKSIYGSLQGVQGILHENLIDLGLESPADLERVANTPCAALRSIRKKPSASECERMVDVFRAHNIRFFFYIGGNDSAESAYLLHQVAQSKDYDLRLFHVPKTIDNDLEVTDHCPGYPSAARFVTQAFMGDNEDNRSLGGVKINVVMGRHAGWLTAAAALARHNPSEGPHLVYLPEVDFEIPRFVQDVGRTLDQFGRCVVAVSEGIHNAKGELIQASTEVDSHGNPLLAGGALGDQLAEVIKRELGVSRVRADTFGYLQRSYFGVVSEVDAREARAVGRHAVELALAGHDPHGSVIIRRESTRPYEASLGRTDLENVAQKTRCMPAEFLAGTNGVSPAFVEWLAPLVGDLPRPGRLSDLPVPRRLG
ncbi:MAG: 6-phosphofructokinase [Planctomycetota bacterium]